MIYAVKLFEWTFSSLLRRRIVIDDVAFGARTVLVWWSLDFEIRARESPIRSFEPLILMIMIVSAPIILGLINVAQNWHKMLTLSFITKWSWQLVHRTKRCCCVNWLFISHCSNDFGVVPLSLNGCHQMVVFNLHQSTMVMIPKSRFQQTVCGVQCPLSTHKERLLNNVH